jgi:hypothetical protein
MNRLKIKYTELVNISIKQKFYENNICGKFIIEPTPDMVFIPAAETQLLMKRLNFLFKSYNQTNGFTILTVTDNKSVPPNYRLLFLPKNGEKLTFFILLNNPELLNFNELPLPGDASKIFYFSNKISGNPALRKDPLYLTHSSGGVHGTDDRIKKSGSMYAYHHSVAAANAKLKHLHTDIELLPYSFKNLGGAGGCDLVFNLKDLPIGKVKLFIDGSEIETFYYTGDNVPASVLGVIELNLSDALDQNYRLIESDNSLMLPTPLYYIEFKNRKTTWRYTFKLTPTSPLYIEINKLTPIEKPVFMTNLKIVCNNNTITFSQSAPDASTIIFESENPFALAEKYSIPVTFNRLKLALTKYTGVPMKETTVIENLPYPSTNMIDARNPAFIYSDIFLTI